MVCQTTDKPARLSYPAGMSKVEQYRRGLELCLANAAKAPFAELRAVWQTIGKSYAVLAELESNGGGTHLRPSIANRQKTIPGATGLIDVQ